MDTILSDELENKYNRIDQTNPNEWNSCWQEISIVIIIKLVQDITFFFFFILKR